MKIRLKRKDEFIDVGDSVIVLEIGNKTFRLNEDVFGGLCINKSGDRNQISIEPNVANNITLL